MSKRVRKSKYTFTLKNIDMEKLNKTYKFFMSKQSIESLELDTESSQTDSETEDDIMDIHLENKLDKLIKPEKAEKPYKNTTKISDLNNTSGAHDIISFIDESKRIHNCYVSMIDFKSLTDIKLLKYNCFWCRHSFDTKPIGCPIKYIPNQIEKKYYSHISRDTYTIKENITNKKAEYISEKISTAEIPVNTDKNIVTDNNTQILLKKGGYYETDGIFCSFNCCQAWIDDNKHCRLYDLSCFLLKKLYNEIMNVKSSIIDPAPSWRLLENYGGHLTILKFREGFNKIEYKYHGNTNEIGHFLPISFLYGENIKF